MITLGERFKNSMGAPIDVDGRKVIAMYRRLVSFGERVDVFVSSPIKDAVQGFVMKLTEGYIEIDEQRIKDVAIWTDTAPSHFAFWCRPKKETAELRVWNRWRDSRGTAQAWIGNAGMIAEEKGSEVVLSCSSGRSSFRPDELTIKMTFAMSSSR